MSSITNFPVPSDPRDVYGSDCPIRLDDEPPYIHLSAPQRTDQQAAADGATDASTHLSKTAQRRDRLEAINAILDEVTSELFNDDLLASVMLAKITVQGDWPERWICRLPIDLSQQHREMVARYTYRVNDLLYMQIERYRMSEAICGVMRHWLHDRGIHGPMFTEQQLRECAERAAGQAQQAKDRTLNGSWPVDARTMASAKLNFLRLTELP